MTADPRFSEKAKVALECLLRYLNEIPDYHKPPRRGLSRRPVDPEIIGTWHMDLHELVESACSALPSEPANNLRRAWENRNGANPPGFIMKPEAAARRITP